MEMEIDTDLKKELGHFLNDSCENVSKQKTKTISVTCLQFGDTGKGKFVDLFANWAHIIARGTGGDNAGHMVICNGVSKTFHLIPSGIAKDGDGKINVIGSGTVLYPKTLLGEISLLHSNGMTTNNLMIALNAKLTMPYHILFDRLSELGAGKAKIGTTGKGIGPAYSDFIARHGLIVNDLLNPKVFRQKLEKVMVYVNKSLAGAKRSDVKEILFHEHLESGLYYQESKSFCNKGFFNIDAIVEKYVEYGEELARYISDTDVFMRDNHGKKNILGEGAQGSLLDIDYGTYPFVTSSNCGPAGLAKGVGLKESDVDISFGIMKGFYMTRVGKGPFPTEIGSQNSEVWCNGTGSREKESLFGSLDLNIKDPFLQGVAIRRAGGEYGATTGRPRRTGWVDLPLLKQALDCGIKNIILTKLDVLRGLDTIRVCYGYQYNGPEYQYGPSRLTKGMLLEKAIMHPEVLDYCIPLYKDFPGWNEDISVMKSFAELPKSLKDILTYIFSDIEAKPRIISVGPRPEETIFID